MLLLAALEALLVPLGVLQPRAPGVPWPPRRAARASQGGAKGTCGRAPKGTTAEAPSSGARQLLRSKKITARQLFATAALKNG